jgi:serine/threonine-protein kinase
VKQFGPWTLEHLIAVGGMGEVWRARRSPTDAPVALKRMHTHLVHHAEALAIFANEQMLATTLRWHPNVTHAVASGSEGNLPYVALEVAPGADLRSIVAPVSAAPANEGPLRTAAKITPVMLPRAQAISIVATACDAADHMHSNGWVHGDVDPGNLVVDVLPSEPMVTLVDLGISRRVGEGGPVRGTHAYMAPEQIQGGVWTAATDVFALGVVLWELISGTRLFHRGPSWLSIAAVMEHTPGALPDRDLDAIARAALEKDPAKRLGSAAELAARLRALIAN